MIVLKILLIILLVILGLILLVLILPVGGDVSFIDGKLKYKVRLWRLNVMDSEGGGVLGWLKKRKKKKKPDNSTDTDTLDDIEDIGDLDDISPAVDEYPVAEVTEETSSDNNSEEAVGESQEDEEQTAENAAADLTDDSAEKEKKKSRKKSKEPAEKAELTDKIDFILSTIDVAWSPLKRIFKGFRFSELYIDFIIANEDAYKCAINYGRFCGIIYNGIATLSRIFTVRLKTVDVQAGFGLKKGRWDAALSLDFRAGTVVIAGFAFLITFIFKVFIPSKFNKRKLKKSAPCRNNTK